MLICRNLATLFTLSGASKFSIGQLIIVRGGVLWFSVKNIRKTEFSLLTEREAPSPQFLGSRHARHEKGVS
jgi:hypothetical protein